VPQIFTSAVGTGSCLSIPRWAERYAHLASDSIRTAYDTAIAKARLTARFVAGPTGQFVPDHIDWLHSEMIKTRVAHGYCSRHLTAGACTYANICEQTGASDLGVSSAC